MTVVPLVLLSLAAASPTPPQPVPLGVYSRCVSGKFGSVCDPILQVAASGKRISALTAYPRCSSLPLRKAPSARLVKGRFRYAGTLRNRLNRRVKVRIAGHVLSRKRIRVSYRLTTAKCTDRTHTVTLSYRRTGRPGEIG